MLKYIAHVLSKHVENVMNISLPPQPILLPSPVLIVGTYDSEGKPNMMNAAWGGIAASRPPCISISIREATLSYHNIVHNGAFTVGIPSENFVKEADFVGIVSGYECDKFKETGLTPERSKLINAPFVREFPYSLECKLIRQVDVGSHTMFIGEIVGMVACSDVLNEAQLPDIEKVRPIFFGSFGSRAYYGIGGRLGDAFSIGNTLDRG
jgi:flavin reductase (DIM6/NTAB) family NADH-FMN oxidoreductase RutF